MPDIEQPQEHAVPDRAPLSAAAKEYAVKISRDFDTLTPELQAKRFEELKYMVQDEDPEAEYSWAEFLHDIGKADAPVIEDAVPHGADFEPKKPGTVPDNLPVADAVSGTEAEPHASDDAGAQAAAVDEIVRTHTPEQIAQLRKQEIEAELDALAKQKGGKRDPKFASLREELTQVKDILTSLQKAPVAAVDARSGTEPGTPEPQAEPIAPIEEPAVDAQPVGEPDPVTVKVEPIIPREPVPGVDSAAMAAGIEGLDPQLTEPVRGMLAPGTADLRSHEPTLDVPPAPRGGDVAANLRATLEATPEPSAGVTPSVPDVLPPAPDVLPSAPTAPKPVRPVEQPIVATPVEPGTPLDRFPVTERNGEFDFSAATDDDLARENIRLEQLLLDPRYTTADPAANMLLEKTRTAILTELGKRGYGADSKLTPELEATRRQEGKIVDQVPTREVSTKARAWSKIGKWKPTEIEAAKTDVETELLSPDHRPGSLRDTILQERRRTLERTATERGIALAWDTELPPALERPKSEAELELMAAEAKVTKLRGSRRKFLHAAKKSDIESAEQELEAAKSKVAAEQLESLFAKYAGEDLLDPDVAQQFGRDLVEAQLLENLGMQVAGYGELGRVEHASLLKGTGPQRMGVGFAAALLASAAKWGGQGQLAEGLNLVRATTTGIGVATGLKGALQTAGKFMAEHFGDLRSFSREQVAQMPYTEKKKYLVARLASLREHGGQLGTETRGVINKTEDRTMEYLWEGIENDTLEMAVEGVVEMATRGIPVNEIVASRTMSEMAVEHGIGETLEGRLLQLKVISLTQTVAVVAAGLLSAKAVAAGGVTADLAKWVTHAIQNPGEALQEVGRNIVNAQRAIWEGASKIFHHGPAETHLTPQQLEYQQQATETARLGGVHTVPTESPAAPLDTSLVKGPNPFAGHAAGTLHPTELKMDHNPFVAPAPAYGPHLAPLEVPGIEVHAGVSVDSIVTAERGDNLTKILEHQLSSRLGASVWESLGRAGQDNMVGNLLHHFDTHAAALPNHVALEHLGVGDKVDLSHAFGGKEGFDLNSALEHSTKIASDPHAAAHIIAQRMVTEHYAQLHPHEAFDPNYVLGQSQTELTELTQHGEQAMREALMQHGNPVQAQEAAHHAMRTLLQTEMHTHASNVVDGAPHDALPVSHIETPSAATIPTIPTESVAFSSDIPGEHGSVLEVASQTTPVASGVHVLPTAEVTAAADTLTTAHSVLETGRATQEMATTYRAYNDGFMRLTDGMREHLQANYGQYTLDDMAKTKNVEQLLGDVSSMPGVNKTDMVKSLQKLADLMKRGGFEGKEKLKSAMDWIIDHRP